MGLLSRIFSKSQPKEPPFTIPLGKSRIEVYGERHRNKEIRAFMGGDKIREITVSITPPIDYQKQQGWPKPPFVNINTEGSIVTTKENWLGYVPYGYGNKLDFPNLMRSHSSIEARAVIEKHGRDYEIFLLVPEQKRDAVDKMSVSHDKTAQKGIDILYSNGIERVNVDLLMTTNDAGKPVYGVMYKGHKIGVVGPVNTKKLAPYVKNGSKFMLDITYYAANDKKYTSLVVV